MLQDPITLSVDVANTGSPSDIDYERYREYDNRSEYIGPGHTPASRNIFAVFAREPKAAGNFKGVSKSAIKITVDQVVPGIDGSDITAPIILELSASVPVGVTSASLIQARQTLLAALDYDDLMDDIQVISMI